MCDSAYVGIRRSRLSNLRPMAHPESVFGAVSLTRRREFLSLEFAHELKENEMNKDQKDGVVNQAKGKVNEVVGKVTGNKRQEAKGDLQQAGGKVQKGVGDARENVKDAIRKP
jgi:uncharacterized protein YjbJ (UPF0337 family)